MKMRGMWTIWALMTMIQSVDSWKLLARTYHNFCLHLNDKCLFLKITASSKLMDTKTVYITNCNKQTGDPWKQVLLNVLMEKKKFMQLYVIARYMNILVWILLYSKSTFHRISEQEGKFTFIYNLFIAEKSFYAW